VTFRTGGVSQGLYHSWNLATHVGDAPEAVSSNRRMLRQRLDLPGEPAWLTQSHGSRIVEIKGEREAGGEAADASFSSAPDTVCAVLTADCLPVLLTDGFTVAAVHGGWRGLLGGILDNALTRPPWRRPPIAWLGPAIGPKAFEVGAEVRQTFLTRDPSFAAAFQPAGDRFLADLYQLATIILRQHRVSAVFGGGFCTYHDPERFFSYRRDGICGRMATLIWRAG